MAMNPRSLVDTRPCILVGPSGSGKTTLIKALQQLRPDVFCEFVSHTSRPPRDGEQDGVDYHFRSASVFWSLVEADELVEWVCYAGNLYGLSRAELVRGTDDGRIRLTAMTRDGVISLRRQQLACRYVKVSVASLEQLEMRLRKRGDTQSQMAERMALARAEMQLGDDDDFDLVVVNDDVHKSTQTLLDFLLGVENK